MREMKDSGIEWIGDLPEKWSFPKITYILEYSHPYPIGDGDHGSIKATDYAETGIPFIRVQNLGYATSLNLSDVVYITEEQNATIASSTLQPKDILFAKTGATIGKVGIVPDDLLKANTTSHVGKITVNDDVEAKFIFYVLSSYIGYKQFWDVAAQKSTRPELSIDEIKTIHVVLPDTKAEQVRIVTYLDKKCAEIDSLTADIQTQIDTLEQYKRSVITEAVTKGLNPDAKMKDSGIQWIGKMPSHWDCIRGKYILRYLQKPVREDDGVITCFRDGEVTLRSNRREDGFTMSDKEIGYQGIDVGDLVVHGMDGFAGAIGISDSRGKASPVLNVLDTEQSKRYIMYYLRSMAYSDVFVALATGIRVRSCDLRWNKLADLMYPVPPTDEQNEIVGYIDSVIERADAVIADKKDQLVALEDYKKSLIFEYVTGKKEVPTNG